MNDDNNNLDLLDLDDNDSMDSLPDVPAFVTPRPKKPWLLLSVGVAVIILATYVIVRAIGDETISTVEIDLDAPVEITADDAAPVDLPDMNVMPPVKQVQVAPKQEAKTLAQDTKPVVQEVKTEEVKVQPQSENVGVPVRVVEERKEVKFNPTTEVKTETKTITVEKKPVEKTSAAKTQTSVKKAEPTVVKSSVSSWYVQFGSYSTRALAEAAQRKIANGHKSLFAGKQFVILAAQLKNGTTTYRLRVGFNNSNDANGFCRNAKSDGLDCYVAR